MATQQELMRLLERSAHRSEVTADAYDEVLTSEGEIDVTLSDGTVTPNLNKRIKAYGSQVTSVVGKKGDVTIGDISESLELGSASKYNVADLPITQKQRDEFVGSVVGKKGDVTIGDISESLELGSASKYNVADLPVNQNQRDAFIGSVESIADLIAIKSPRNGQTVYVKNKQGQNFFSYDSSKSSVNNRVTIFNGWVRIIENNTYTPQMAGCVCDGVVDDGANLEKLMFHLESNEISGTVVFDSDTYINTLSPATGKQQYQTSAKIGIRLVSNVNLEIKSGVTVSFGDIFHNSQTSLLNAMYKLSADDWYGRGQNKNIKIFGGGTLDFTRTGGMGSRYWGNRYAIHLGSTLDFEVFNITLKGGCFSNTIAGSKWGDSQNIHNCTFEDNFTDSGIHNEDHSTVYLVADNSNCYNNKFNQTSISSKVIACTCELHGNNQSYHGNIIDGYWSAVYLTAMEAAWEHTAGDIVSGQRAFNNIAKCTTRFSWFDGTANIKIKGFAVYDNSIEYIDFPSDAELETIGISKRPYRGTLFFEIVTASSTERDYTYGAVDALKIYNNTQSYSDQINSDYSTFLVYSGVFGNNLKIYNNIIASKQLIISNGEIVITPTHIVRGLEFFDNIIDGSKLSSSIAIGMSLHSISDSRIDINIRSLSHNPSSASFISMTLVDGSSSINNNIVIKCPAKLIDKRTNRWLDIYGSNTSFSDNNSFTVPLNVNFNSYASGNNIVYYTESTATFGASYGEIKSNSWFPSTAKVAAIPRFASKERRTGQAATLSFTVTSTEGISELVGNKTIPIQIYKDM